MSKITKGNISKNKYNIFFSRLKITAVIVFEISWLQDVIMTLQKGHNSTKGDNPELKKNMWQLFFAEESVNEISKLYLYKF